AHKLVVLHAAAIGGDSDAARALERSGGGDLLALLPGSDAPGGINPDDGIAVGDILDELDRAGVVRHRHGVGHADDGGETAGGGGARAARDGLLVRLAGLAEVDVNIDQAGAGDEAGGIDLAGAFFVGGAERFDEDAVADENIAVAIAAGGGIDEVGVGDPEGGHGGIGHRRRRRHNNQASLLRINFLN